MQEQKSQLDASTASAKQEKKPDVSQSDIAKTQERKSRKTGGADIIKELEDYVKDKKTNTNKYLDDISEFDAS